MAKLTFPGFTDCAFIPYAPRSVKESLEFDTEVMITHNGSEDRTATRAIGRQTYQYEIPTTLLTRQSPFNLAEQNIRGRWAVPIWSEAQFKASVSGTTISCDTLISDFKADSLVMFFKSNDQWELRQIASVADGSITLTSGLGAMSGVYMIPVNAATIVGNINHQVASHQTVFSMSFEMEEPFPHQTHIAVFVILDHSDIMFGRSLTRAKASLVNCINALRGAVVNSGVKIDLGICLWSTSAVTHSWLAASPSNLDDAEALVAALTADSELFPDPADAMSAARTFFETTSSSVLNRKNYLFYITGSNADTTAAAAASANLLNGTGAYSGNKSVECRSVIFSQTSDDPAGQQRELLNNWNNLQSGVDNWSNDGATGADSGETFGSFTNAYELGLSGRGIRRQLDSVAVSHRTPYQVRAWFKDVSSSGGWLTLRRQPISADTEVGGPFAIPTIEEEAIGQVEKLVATNLGSGVWNWSFQSVLDPSCTSIIVGPGNDTVGQTVVIFAASFRRAIEPDPPTEAAMLLDNASGDAPTVVSDEEPGALERVFMQSLVPSIGYQFGGYEIITDEPDGDSITKSIEKIEDRVDFGGAFTTLSPWLFSRVNSNHAFPKDSLGEVKSFKEFLYRRLGKLRSCYLPTFQYDIHLTALSPDGMTGTCPYADIRSFNNDRTKVVISWADGRWQAVSITSVTDIGGGNAEVGFSVPLFGGLQDVRQICFIGLARFNTDRIEISWIGEQATDTSINFVEISK